MNAVGRKWVAIECDQCPRRDLATVLLIAEPDGHGRTVVRAPLGWAVLRGRYAPGVDPNDVRRWHRATQCWVCPSCFQASELASHPQDRVQDFVEQMLAATDKYGVIWCKQPGCRNVADPAGLLFGSVACEPCIARHFGKEAVGCEG